MARRSRKKHNIESVCNLFKNNYSELILIFLVIFYSFYFSIAALERHELYGSFAYDLGTYDQGVWLLSHSPLNINTIRGMNTLGDHSTYILILLVPLYWIFNSVWVLLITQSVALATSCIPLFLITKKLTKNKLIALILCLAFLQYPFIHFANLEDFHPDIFGLPIMLWLLYFSLTSDWKKYFLFVFLFLMVKEDFALTLFSVGLYVFFKNKKIGVYTMSLSTIYFLLNIFLFMRIFNGIGYFRLTSGYGALGAFGGSFSEIVKNITNLSIWKLQLFTSDNLTYIYKLFYPVGFLPSLSIPAIIPVIPQLFLNTLSSYYYTHSIEYHYSNLITAGIFFATAHLLGKINTRYKRVAIFLSLIILSLSIHSNIGFGHANTRITNIHNIPRMVKNILYPRNEKIDNMNTVISNIPVNKSVSATYNIVPHISHREEIYMFPNPFKMSYWGINGEKYPVDLKSDYIILDTNLIDFEDEKMLDSFLEDKAFELIFNETGIVVMKKVGFSMD